MGKPMFFCCIAQKSLISAPLIFETNNFNDSSTRGRKLSHSSLDGEDCEIRATRPVATPTGWRKLAETPAFRQLWMFRTAIPEATKKTGNKLNKPNKVLRIFENGVLSHIAVHFFLQLSGCTQDVAVKLLFWHYRKARELFHASDATAVWLCQWQSSGRPTITAHWSKSKPTKGAQFSVQWIWRDFAVVYRWKVWVASPTRGAARLSPWYSRIHCMLCTRWSCILALSGHGETLNTTHINFGKPTKGMLPLICSIQRFQELWITHDRKLILQSIPSSFSWHQQILLYKWITWPQSLQTYFASSKPQHCNASKSGSS